MSRRQNILDIFNAHGSIEQLIYAASLERYGEDIIYIRKFGRTGKVGSNDTVDIWPYSETVATKTYLDSGSVMNVVSDDANDTSAGTGARTVFIRGVDGDYNLISETVTLNGTTPVATTQSFLRIITANVTTAGSSRLNEGEILISADSDDSVQEVIPEGESSSSSSHFTVPAGYSAITVRFGYSIYRFPGTSGGVKRGIAEFNVRSDEASGGVDSLVNRLGLITDGNTFFEGQLILPPVTPEKYDSRSVVLSEQNNTGISTFSDILLVKETCFPSNFTIW